MQPTYSSEGLLHALQRNTDPERSLVFNFAGRPVAQLDVSGGNESWTFLTTDHLGTPVAATAVERRGWTAISASLPGSGTSWSA